MIKVCLQNLLFPLSLLEMKYSFEVNSSLEQIQKKRESWEIGFLDAEKWIDFDRLETYCEDKKDFKYIAVLGIWWSSLWAKAVIKALYSEYHNEFMDKKIYFLDNVDPDKISSFLKCVDLKNTQFLVISKSWDTIETISEYVFFWNLLKEKGIETREKNFTVISWRDSFIYKDAARKGIAVFEVPENIGWRFSLLSYVGIVPLALYGVNVRELFAWFTSFKEKCLSKKISENPAMINALIQQYSYFELWKNIKVFFPYIEGFKEFGAWFVQLIWESLWKQGLWMTPMASIGVTDQHSLLQLYWNWPNDKLIIFMEKEESWEDYEVDNFAYSDLLKLEKEWTEKAITQYSRLNYTIKIDKVCEYTLWELILMYEMETAILWEFFYVNTYDQPWVEVWKEITKEKLKEKFGDFDLKDRL